MSTGRFNKYQGPRRGIQMLSNRLMRRVLRFPGERLDKGQPSNSHEGHLSSKSRKEDDRDDSRPVRRYPNSNISGKTRTDGSTKDRKSESTELAGILREELPKPILSRIERMEFKRKSTKQHVKLLLI